MSAGGDLGNPLRKFKLVFLGEQSGESELGRVWVILIKHAHISKAMYVIRDHFGKFKVNPEDVSSGFAILDAHVAPGIICSCGNFD